MASRGAAGATAAAPQEGGAEGAGRAPAYSARPPAGHRTINRGRRTLEPVVTPPFTREQQEHIIRVVHLTLAVHGQSLRIPGQQPVHMAGQQPLQQPAPQQPQQQQQQQQQQNEAHIMADTHVRGDNNVVDLREVTERLMGPNGILRDPAIMQHRRITIDMSVMIEGHGNRVVYKDDEGNNMTIEQNGTSNRINPPTTRASINGLRSATNTHRPAAPTNPRTNDAPAQSPQKRGRGRPRKHAFTPVNINASDARSVTAQAPSPVVGVKRGRGRPRKNPLAVTANNALAQMDRNGTHQATSPILPAVNDTIEDDEQDDSPSKRARTRR